MQAKENNSTVTYKLFKTTFNKTLNYKEAADLIYVDEKVAFSPY